MLLLGEQLQGWDVVGIVVTMLGIALVQRARITAITKPSGG